MKRIMMISAIAAVANFSTLSAQGEAIAVEDEASELESFETMPLDDLSRKYDWKKDHKMKVVARAQLRFVHLGSETLRDRISPQSKLSAIDPSSGDDSYSAVKTRRLRMGVKGTIREKYTYAVDIMAEGLVGTSPSHDSSGDNVDNSAVTQAYIGYNPYPYLQFKLGSFELPYSRDWLTSSSSLTPIERSAASDNMGNFFDSGFQVDGRLFSKTLYYAIGGFNGDGGFFEGRNGKANGSPLAAARLQFDPLGEYKNGKAIWSKAPLLSFGLAGFYQARSGEYTKPYKTADLTDLASGTFDIGLTYGSMNLEAAVFYATAERVNYGGYYGTIAFFISPEFLQGWIKYENFTYTGDEKVTTGLAAGETADLSETRYASMGLNIYPGYRHHLKLQIAYVMGLNQGLNASEQKYQDLGRKDDWFTVMAHVTF